MKENRVEIRQSIFEVARWPLTTALNLGGFVLDATGLNDKPIRLFDEEPLSRAETALDSANHAIHKNNPDQELAQFEVLRAAGGVTDMRLRYPDTASELGNQIIAAAFEAAFDPNGDDEEIYTEDTPDILPEQPPHRPIPTQRQPSE
jgi:hypothetical protein